MVVARGGFSGMFPDSSSLAYLAVGITSASNTVFWCDIQLTKDGAGICGPDVMLDNFTNIAFVYTNRQNSYVVNGVALKGWFSIDFTLNELLGSVSCKFDLACTKTHFRLRFDGAICL